jgi:hypothetical protein
MEHHKITFLLLALQPQFWPLAYLHESLRFTSVYKILDSRQDYLGG